ncbi:MAG TPA: hypothetical protein VMR16_02755 [Candidatus Saccharimonadales bacterium]|nr:hypothetical protein [Candidatus Saccharimonadales bacterium]
MTNSFDVIDPFSRILERESIDDVQIIGGINSAALVHPDTIIDLKAKEIIVPADICLSTVRDDKTKSLRDIDVFVQSSDPRYIDSINDLAEVTIGAQLERSIFGILPSEALERQMRNPLGVAALFNTVVSDRYMVTDETALLLPDGMVSDDSMVKSLFPFAVPLSKEALETWTVTDGRDMRVKVPSPAAQLLNYITRSNTGVRPKDSGKVENMYENIFSKAPELRDWVLDGPGAPQVELGLLLRGLTPKKPHVDYFGTGKPILTHQEMVESESFMLQDISNEEKLRIVGRAAHKAVLVNFFESNPTFVALWQNGFEQNPLVQRIIKNK